MRTYILELAEEIPELLSVEEIFDEDEVDFVNGLTTKMGPEEELGIFVINLEEK